ncbi:hypothetical protein [Streptomyces sp. UNOB3_S3]|uniref:hypothetical protein n=1 Tax=Streptomyces sp. UNOB3_S3 TaxID=2871682 RepID=UPI001E3F3E83|nr:hypothetical protein [Streptomyces sp. UNOB3_S3]MCC3776056.1 hypothetical protein [Streptomyces sp. UNOB3_S3]
MGERGEWQRARFPVREDLLRPTALGNALTAAEARAGRRYELDAVVVWTRLEPLLSDPVRAAVAERRTTMDAAARLSVTAALCAPLSVWLLWRSGWWLLLAAALLAAARIAYTAAVHAAIDYGESVAAAFDLHRFDLLTALHLPPARGPGRGTRRQPGPQYPLASGRQAKPPLPLRTLKRTLGGAPARTTPRMKTDRDPSSWYAARRDAGHPGVLAGGRHVTAAPTTASDGTWRGGPAPSRPPRTARCAAG